MSADAGRPGSEREEDPVAPSPITPDAADDAGTDRDSDRERPPTGFPIYVTAPTVDAPQPRLSIVRILIAIVVIAAVVLGGTEIVIRAAGREDANTTQWFAPYVDVTLTPRLDFQDQVVNPNLDVVLAFVVASTDDACEPSWGSYHGLDEAASALDLDRRIARLRQRGGDVIVSFGGVANDELATGCTDPDELAAAYQAVVTRYDLRTIDLDLEGAALTDPAAAARRATAIGTVQAAERDAGRSLDVWLTLPVSPAGLSADGVAAVDAFLGAGVDVAGVNVMAMDYAESRTAGTDFVTASLAAVDATQAQLVQAYGRTGTTLTPAAAYARMGITPMIGQNDTLADRLDTAGAQQLVDGARDRGLIRFSMWSLNRDARCGGNIDPLIANATCSGVEQTRLQFSSILGAVGGRPASAAGRSGSTLSTRTAPVADGLGPFDEWRDRREYDTGDQVVWAGQVYVAKWWNVGAQPDAPVENEWDTPWRMVGPILESDATATTGTTLPADTYAEWTRDVEYAPGEWVQHRGIGYRAKWWTRGVDPSADVDNPWESPWEPLGDIAGEAPPSTSTTTTAPPAVTPSATTTTAPG